MNKRELITSTSAVIVAALAGNASAQEDTHAHHHDTSVPNAALISATSNCVVKGQICVVHCLELLANGDKEMASCAKSASQMLTLCGALQSLAAQQSSYLPALAKTVMEACLACENECRKHDKKHSQCKDCGDACAACAKQCNALAA